MLGTSQSNIFVDYGPMQMTIQAVFAGNQSNKQVQDAGRYAKELLTEVARQKEIAKRTQQDLPSSVFGSEVLQRMISAVRQSTDKTLTPMAAVAGTIADMTADYVADLGAIKVIVNNGGDIAIRLQEGQTAKVGIAVSRNETVMPTILITKESGIEGIATSGLGGRSFTKGIASAAVVAAKSAALADACATSIGNAVFTEHPHIRLALAEELDPNTDIRGHYVVKEVGLLPPDIIQKALNNGRTHGIKLLADQVIFRAALFIEDWSTLIPDNWLMSDEQLLYK
ncbi:FAD:protein FMN transferase [Pelosinus propionicus]|uniref:FAD:protein FMN transferase n=1 Tax=Pelosinus propionicus DSM 13327 TaxID=1123291 RepID=A0A1I4I2D7_9FIRM|nr:FAD:protein FMN transferase [Pelosinus propionicus]SFL48539.1 hypothetical protein SAMN04490355_100666 [Pelosinus propionicus DSM 13327]